MRAGPPRVMDTERLTSTDRLAWLEKKLLALTAAVEDITKGRHQMGYKTGNDVTVHICGRHVQGLFDPKPKSLREITQEIDEAKVIGE